MRSGCYVSVANTGLGEFSSSLGMLIKLAQSERDSRLAHSSFLFQLWKLFWICKQASRWSYCLLLLGMFENWSWFLSFGSYLFLLLAIIDSSTRTFYAGNATLDYHLLSSVLWCYSAIYFISTLVCGDLLVMEFNFWWSFPSGGVILHTASALHSGGDFVSFTTAAVLTLSAVVERWVWHRPVHTAIHSSIGEALTC